MKKLLESVVIGTMATISGLALSVACIGQQTIQPPPTPQSRVTRELRCTSQTFTTYNSKYSKEKFIAAFSIDNNGNPYPCYSRDDVSPPEDGLLHLGDPDIIVIISTYEPTVINVKSREQIIYV